jgi:hypothetical protein
MAGASFVHSGYDRIHDTKAGERSHALGRKSLARPDRAVSARRMLQSPHDRCAYRNDPRSWLGEERRAARRKAR